MPVNLETRRSFGKLSATVSSHLSADSTVALLAERGAHVAGISECLEPQGLCSEFGAYLGLRSKCDSSAVRGIIDREETVKMKHLEVKHSWVQLVITRRVIRVEWDVLTAQVACWISRPHSKRTRSVEEWRTVASPHVDAHPMAQTIWTVSPHFKNNMFRKTNFARAAPVLAARRSNLTNMVC